MPATRPVERRGRLATWYEGEGGPLGLWRQWCDDVSGRPVDGGHFFPEEHPIETAAALEMFFGGDADQNR
jgi:haloacetate dehalogenase